LVPVLVLSVAASALRYLVAASCRALCLVVPAAVSQAAQVHSLVGRASRQALALPLVQALVPVLVPRSSTARRARSRAMLGSLALAHSMALLVLFRLLG
jgi:hypothetical protein